jgi:hypothetical protein
LQPFELSIVANGNQISFQVSERENRELNVEVVHDIGVVSLQGNTIWSNKYWQNTISFTGLHIFFVTLSRSLVILCLSLLLLLFSFSLGIHICTFRLSSHCLEKA